MAGLATLAFFAVVAFPRAAIPLIDGDVWWHIRAGMEIAATRQVATTDQWTIAGLGMPWTSQDWLSNVLVASVFGIGSWGSTLLSVLFSAMVMGGLVLLWRAIGARGDSSGWLGRIVWLAVGLTVAGPTLGVRVQVVDLPLTAAAVLSLWSYLRHRRRRTLAWLPLLALVWANLHAGWLLLFLIGGAVVVGESVDRALRRQLHPEPLAWRDIGWLVAALVVAGGAIAINPNGPALYLYPLETSGIQAHRDFLAEWQPPDLATLPGQLFIGFILVGVLPALAIGWRLMRLADALVLVGLTIMAATAARFLLVAGPIGAAVIAVTLGRALAGTRIGRGVAPLLNRMSRPPRSTGLAGVNLALAAVLIVAGLVVVGARASPSAERQAIAEHMPVAAVDWMLSHEPGERAFNTYAWGGYLGFRRPELPTYIDGRSDIYGDAPIRSYADAISLRSDPGALLDAQRIDHVLFNTDHPFADWLNANAEWERVYSDPLASVWIRIGADHE
ncbi:MAG: hypothetical protein ACR2I5_12625 [Candidatus Limnocylindria bacterium]